MENEDKKRLTNDEIRNKHYLKRDQELYELDTDLKKKTRLIYIVGFIIFVMIGLIYAFS